jgi:hypothetical protein
LSNRQLERLQRFAPVVRGLARKRSETKARRYIINQHGNGPLFAALLTPIIAEAARILIEKVVGFVFFSCSYK